MSAVTFTTRRRFVRPEERHLGAVGRADAHVLQVGERAAIRLRVAHHHAHVVATALDALGLLAVEGLAHLAGEILHGQTQGLRLRQDLELDLALAGPGRVGDVDHAGVRGETLLHRLRRLDERCVPRAAQLEVDGAAGREQVGHEHQLGRVRDLAGQLAPALGDVPGADPPLLRRHQLEHHLAHVRARVVVHAVHRAERLLPERYERVLDQASARRRVLGVERPRQLARRFPQLRQTLRRDLRRCALRHRQQPRDVVRLDRGEEAEAQAPAADDAARQHQQRQTGGDAQIAPRQHLPQEGPIALFDEALEPRGEAILEALPALAHATAPPRARVAELRATARQVARQHQLGLDQRVAEAGDHRDAQEEEYLAHPARDHEQRHEGRHRRQHAEDHGNRDLVGAVDGGPFAIPRATLVGVHVLAHDDGVVHQDPQHQDEGEQRDLIDGDPEERHRHQRAQERDRHACAHP
jgi:hypothetical protein